VIVLDASAAVELLLGTRRGATIASRVGTEPLHAPHLLDVEVASALRRLEQRGAIDTARAGEGLRLLGDLDVERSPHEGLLQRAWQLRHNLTLYDGIYLALAEALEAPLLTCDTRLARQEKHHAQVEVL
jgi:predicted nucleic acid-binding protein